MVNRLLLLVNNRDVNFTSLFKYVFTEHFSAVTTHAAAIQTRAELVLLAKRYNCTHIATSNFTVFKKVSGALDGTETENRGSIVKLPASLKAATSGESGASLPCMLIPPIANCFTTGGAEILKLYLGKLSGKLGVSPVPTHWEFCTPANLEVALLHMSNSFLCAVDIETSRDELRITSCSYTLGSRGKNGEIVTRGYVVRCEQQDYPFCITAIRRLNLTEVPKVMQRGTYDSCYFLRFNAPVRNYLYDTYHLACCLWPEFPHTLHFLSSIFNQKYSFWKDEGSRNLYEYNAKDTHETFWLFLAMVEYCSKPQHRYALSNYAKVFPILFPCISCAMDGLEIDLEIQERLLVQAEQDKKAAQQRLGLFTGEPDFNPASPKQVPALLRGLGFSQAKKSDTHTLQHFSEASPLYERIADAIRDYRKHAKAISNYFKVPLLHNRLMYELDPTGTISGRMASKSSPFWAGTQIQNIPPYAREMVVAPDGWSYVCVDKAQAESYCTGFLSQDQQLLEVLHTSPDFHCTNASLMFGIPFKKLFDVATGEKLNKPIRNIAKKVNHGANYNMQEATLLQTMGTANVLEAQRLLGLPAAWKPKVVCKELLNRFDTTYPRIRNEWYRELIDEVQKTGKLETPDGWIVRTFMNPAKNKPDLNSVVSLKPQGLSARLVNKAFYRVWRELQLVKYRGKFRLKAQIHDEIMQMVHDSVAKDAAQDVADMMVVPIEINGRVMSIPSTYEIAKSWKDCK